MLDYKCFLEPTVKQANLVKQQTQQRSSQNFRQIGKALLRGPEVHRVAHPLVLVAERPVLLGDDELADGDDEGRSGDDRPE